MPRPGSGRPSPQIVAAFREAAHRYATADKPRDRAAAAGELTKLWRRLRETADAAGRLSDRFPTERGLEETLASAIDDDANGDRPASRSSGSSTRASRPPARRPSRAPDRNPNRLSVSLSKGEGAEQSPRMDALC